MDPRYHPGSMGSPTTRWVTALRPSWRGLLVLLGVCLLAAPWWNIPRDQADSAGMLAHLHALLVDGDLLFDNEYATLRMSPLFSFVTPEGVVSNHWPAGASWLQAPGYALGLLAATVLEGLGVGHASPLGVVPVLGVRAWAVVVLVVGVRAVARWAATMQSDPASTGARTAGWAIAIIFVGATPILYYAFEAPLRPHLWGASVCVGLVLLWSSPERGSPWARTVALASLAGLATYVRPQLGPLWLLVAHDAWSGPQRWRRLGLAVVTFAPWPALHLRTQLWMYGDQLTDYAGPVSHHTSYFLFSTHHGVLTWCPVLALGAAAVVWSAIRRDRGAWLVLALLVWQVWLDGGMRSIEPGSVLGTRTWAGGVSFGPRKLVDVLPLMLPAVVGAVARLRARGHGRTLVVIAGACCIPTLLLHLSAWLDPGATTGGIMGSTEYLAAMRRPFDASAWPRAWAQRSLPLAVPMVVSVVVATPSWALVSVARGWIGRRAQADEPLRRVGLGATVGLLLMHGWLAAMLLRSDGAREAEPQRMLTAAARLTPAHIAMVRRIGAHHIQLRARLGPGAAPAPRAVVGATTRE